MKTGEKRDCISFGEIMDLSLSIKEQRLWGGKIVCTYGPKVRGNWTASRGISVYDPHDRFLIHIGRGWNNLMVITRACPEVRGTYSFHLSPSDSIQRLVDFTGECKEVYRRAGLILREFYHARTDSMVIDEFVNG